MKSKEEESAAGIMPAAVNPWECSGSDRPRYLHWVWEVSQLPFVFTAFGENRDPHKLKLARAWKTRFEAWCSHQFWLQERGNKNAWNYDRPQRSLLLQSCSGTEDEIEDGEQLMLEIGYYGISDEWRTNI